MESLFESIGDAYNSLIQRGRQQDAFNLREATKKFAAAGSKFGVNQFARNRAMNDLKAQMNAASKVVESKAIADKLRAQSAVAGQIANVEAREFQQQLQEAQFAEQKRSALFQEDLAGKQLELQKQQLGQRDALARAQLRLQREGQMRGQLAAAQASLGRKSPIASRAQTGTISGLPASQVIQAREEVLRKEQERDRRTAGGFLTTGFTGRSQVSPRSLAIAQLAGAGAGGGGGFRSRQLKQPEGGGRATNTGAPAPTFATAPTTRQSPLTPLR